MVHGVPTSRGRFVRIHGYGKSDNHGAFGPLLQSNPKRAVVSTGCLDFGAPIDRKRSQFGIREPAHALQSSAD
ncbi:MAG: hypothetical protein WCD69_15200 [Xanthobacteraceae bacterium]